MHSPNLVYKSALRITVGIKVIGVNLRPHHLLSFLTLGNEDTKVVL